MLHLPGYRNIRVNVNSEGAGTTDSTGTLVLRNLSTYHDNTVTVTTADLPISVSVTSPVHVVPPMAAPIDIAIPVLSRGGFAMRVVDETGAPLPAASYLTAGAVSYTHLLAPRYARLMARHSGSFDKLRMTITGARSP